MSISVTFSRWWIIIIGCPAQLHMPALHDQEGQEPLYMRHRDQQGGQEKHAIETKRLLSVVVFIFKTTFFYFKIKSNMLNLLF
jgi:hypothetical protein